MSAMESQIIGVLIVYSTVVRVQIKENIKAPRHWPLCGEFTRDRWIPRTKGQLIIVSTNNQMIIAQTLRAWANLKWYSFCLFVVVSQSLWRRVVWELPGYFRLIFHICVTRFNNSVTHELSVTIRFILCETIIACFLLGRLFNSLTARIVLVGKFWYVGSC